MSAANKITKVTQDPIELTVAQALYDLETSVADLKADLRPLQISAAREVDVGAGKKAIVVFVPVPQLKSFHKIQQRLTRELEKKFSDRHVVFVAQRRILKKPGRRSRTTQKRPRSRTLTAVHEKILEDLVFPTEIVGKRTRNLVDGRKVQKVYVLLPPIPALTSSNCSVTSFCSFCAMPCSVLSYTGLALTECARELSN
ncbi:ribosomal protein S7A [Savitreella phatthalungensis]